MKYYVNKSVELTAGDGAHSETCATYTKILNGRWQYEGPLGGAAPSRCRQGGNDAVEERGHMRKIGPADSVPGSWQVLGCGDHRSVVLADVAWSSYLHRWGRELLKAPQGPCTSPAGAKRV